MEAAGAALRASGLLGLSDRAAALNGDLYVESPPGGGTAVIVRLPIRATEPAAAPLVAPDRG
jgi:signal transduction histidine kinase